MTAIADPAAEPAASVPAIPAPPAPADGSSGYSIEPGNDRVEAIAVMPANQAVAELDAVIHDLYRQGWTTAPQQYSRLLGSEHHVGLIRRTR